MCVCLFADNSLQSTIYNCSLWHCRAMESFLALPFRSLPGSKIIKTPRESQGTVLVGMFSRHHEEPSLVKGLRCSKTKCPWWKCMSEASISTSFLPCSDLLCTITHFFLSSSHTQAPKSTAEKRASILSIVLFSIAFRALQVVILAAKILKRMQTKFLIDHWSTTERCRMEG